jgi:UDP-2-acetamido-3-amino-2,3-dideoxy-glucuronate N-acetyltransferase
MVASDVMKEVGAAGSRAGSVRSTNREPGMPISENVRIGDNVQIFQKDLINLYGCSIGDNTRIGAFVEIQKGSSIGSSCKISSHSFICEGVTIEDEVFIGHGVMFTNDLYPRATATDGRLQEGGDWQVVPTRVRRRASLGSNSTILAGITIGTNAQVGAGAVVTRDVPDNAIVAGVPAQVIGDVRDRAAGRPGAAVPAPQTAGAFGEDGSC